MTSLLGRCVARTSLVALTRLRPGTILIITLDFERPEQQKSVDLYRELAEQLAPEMMQGLNYSDFAAPNWKRTNVRLIERAISRATYGRVDVSFSKLFSFEYRDTRDMYTFGGILTDRKMRRAVMSAMKTWPFYCNGRLRNITKIPRFSMTKKERNYLDSLVHAPDEYSEEKGISEAEFGDYCRFYRFLPIYSEVL
jgi:hypothetical protein